MMGQITAKSAKIKKFRIKEYLDETSFKERPGIRKELINLLGLSPSTFDRVLYANIGDKQELSSTNLIKVARFFNVPPEDMINSENMADDKLIDKLQLVK